MTDEDKKAIVSISENTSGYKTVSIPVEEGDLGAFISGLLGQPQSIQREILGTIDVDHTWLMNVHYIIQQRIHQQHNASLVAFSAEIFYKDGLSRKLTSIESFKTYSEPKSLISTGVKLKWTYLIYFPGKRIPERQELSLFVSEKITIHNYLFPLFSRRIHKSKPGIRYQIDHTERTWGDDMENLLREHIKSCFKNRSPFLEFVQGIAPLIGITSIFALLFGNIILSSLTEKRIYENAAEKFAKLQIPTDNLFLEIRGKIDFLISIQDTILKKGGNPGLYVVFIFIMVFIFLASIVYLTDYEEPSFVIVTDAAIKNRAMVLKKKHRGLVISLVSFTCSITAGVIANYIYYYLTK
jgi:hypothetical protein